MSDLELEEKEESVCCDCCGFPGLKLKKYDRYYFNGVPVYNHAHKYDIGTIHTIRAQSYIGNAILKEIRKLSEFIQSNLLRVNE